MNLQLLLDSVNRKSYATTKVLDYYDKLDEINRRGNLAEKVESGFL